MASDFRCVALVKGENARSAVGHFASDRYQAFVFSRATTLHYIYDLSGNIIVEYDGNGALGREYIWLDESLWQ